MAASSVGVRAAVRCAARRFRLADTMPLDFPTIAVLGFLLVGDGLRDALDVKDA